MQRPARELALASAALIGVVLPADWLYLLLPQITHLQWIACILGGYGFRSCWRLPYPIVALASGIGMGIAVPFLVSHSHSASVALQLGPGLGSNTQPPMGGWRGRQLGSAAPIRGECRLSRARVSLRKGRALGGGRNNLHDRPVGARGVVGGWKAMSGSAAGVCSAGCSPDVRFRSRTMAGSA